MKFKIKTKQYVLMLVWGKLVRLHERLFLCPRKCQPCVSFRNNQPVFTPVSEKTIGNSSLFGRCQHPGLKPVPFIYQLKLNNSQNN